MDAMGRYFILDDYTRLELELRYQSSDAKGRVSLLQELSQRNSLSYEITCWAVQDSETLVRHWIARHGKNLRYGWHFHRTKDGWVNEEPKPLPYDTLKVDPSPLVRASLRENPSTIGLLLEDEFVGANQLERLALMRNAGMKSYSGRRLLERIFDRDDTELNISLPEREDLILAVLTNSEALEHLESADTFSNRVWELAAKWPSDRLPAPVPELTFRHVPVKDEARAKIYKNCNVPTLRWAILESSSDRDTETLKLGVIDEDDNCRDIARAKINQFNLHNQIDAYPETNRDVSKPKPVLTRLERWRESNEDFLYMLGFLAMIPLAIYGLLFTEDGNRIFGKLLEFYHTPLGMVVSWVILIMGGLITVGIFSTLYERYRWFYHCFWLGLIGGFYFFAENQVMTGIFAAYYAASIVLPKIWEELSNELVSKIAARIEAEKTRNINLST